jgi:hypothetical protein
MAELDLAIGLKKGFIKIIRKLKKLKEIMEI